jgi:hypothetical protein
MHGVTTGLLCFLLITTDCCSSVLVAAAANSPAPHWQPPEKSSSGDGRQQPGGSSSRPPPCPCHDAALCRSLPPAMAQAKKVRQGGWELFAFSKPGEGGNWSDFAWDNLTTVAVASRLPTAAEVCLAHSHSARVVILSGATPPPDATNRTAQIDGLVATVAAHGLDGVNLDIERWSGSRDLLTEYVKELAVALRARIAQAQLSFDLGIAPDAQAKAYDHKALSRHLDFIVPMAYDENWGSLIPKANSPVAALAESVKQYNAMGVGPDHLVLALPWYGTEWPCSGPVTRGAPCKTNLGTRTWSQVVSQPRVSGVVGRIGAQNTSAVRLSSDSLTKFFEWADNRSDASSPRHVSMFDDAETLRAKVAVASAVVAHSSSSSQLGRLRGVAMWYAECVFGESEANVAAMWSALGSPFAPDNISVHRSDVVEQVSVPGNTVLHTVQADFVSFTMDTGGISSGFSKADLEAADVLALARGVGPGYLRLSGGAADSLGYSANDAFTASVAEHLSLPRHCTGDDCGNCDAANSPDGPPPLKLPAASSWFNRSSWMRINAFAAKVGLKIIFGLNSKARAATNQRWDGRFGMMELINWTAAQPRAQFPVAGWELGK